MLYETIYCSQQVLLHREIFATTLCIHSHPVPNPLSVLLSLPQVVPARPRPVPSDEADEPVAHRGLPAERDPAPPLPAALREQDAPTQPQGRRRRRGRGRRQGGGPAECVSSCETRVFSGSAYSVFDWEVLCIWSSEFRQHSACTAARLGQFL